MLISTRANTTSIFSATLSATSSGFVSAFRLGSFSGFLGDDYDIASDTIDYLFSSSGSSNAPLLTDSIRLLSLSSLTFAALAFVSSSLGNLSFSSASSVY